MTEDTSPLDTSKVIVNYPEVLKYYPSFVEEDLAGFLQSAKIERQISNNTLVAYRHNILQLFSSLNLYIRDNYAQNNSLQSTASKSSLVNIGNLLGSRKLDRGDKRLDSYSRKSIIDEIETGDNKTARVQVKANDRLLDLKTLTSGLSKQTATIAEEVFNQDLNPLGWQPVQDLIPDFSWEFVQPTVVEELISLRYQSNRSARSRNQLLSSFRTFFKWLLHENRVKLNYPSMVKNLKVSNSLPTPLDEKSSQQIINRDVIKINNFLELRDQVIFELMYSTGVRLSEVCNLNLQDIDFEKDEIRIIGKGNVERIAPLSDQFKPLLAVYLILRERELLTKLTDAQIYELDLHRVNGNNIDLDELEQVLTYANRVVTNARVYLNGSSDRLKAQAKLARSQMKAASSKASDLALSHSESLNLDLDSETSLEEHKLATSLNTKPKTLVSLDQILSLREKGNNLNNSLASRVNSTSSLSEKDESDQTLAEQAELDSASEEAKDDNYESFRKASRERRIQRGRELIQYGGYDLQIQEQQKASHHHKQKAHPLHALFVSTHLKRINARTIQYRLEKRAEDVGFNRRVSPHKLRHSFATRFLENSENLRAVQELLGHKNLVTTQIYTHLDLKYLISIYNKAHPRKLNPPTR